MQKGEWILHYIVFLDTNIFDASNYNFHNELFTKLYDYVNRGIIELQISSVVKGEVSRHIYDKVKKRIEEINLNISSRDLKMVLVGKNELLGIPKSKSVV